MSAPDRWAPMRLLAVLFALWVTQSSYNDHLNLVSGARTRIHPNEEPSTDKIYNNYRMLLISSPNLYYLKFAGLLNESELNAVYLEDQVDKSGKFVKGQFAFNSSEFFRKLSTIKWFVPLDERTALQVYDDPRDLELAKGPQVNQQLCGLQLDYMLHMVQKYMNNIDDSTEWSLFNIMHTFDSPRLGTHRGNLVFLGDYQTCTTFKLNVIKQELLEVDRKGAEKYFSSDRNIETKPDGIIYKIIDLLMKSLGPFVGFVHDQNHVSLGHVNDKLRALPMRYCMASLRWPSWSNRTFYRRNTNFRTAACLPETCDSRSINYHYDKIKRLVDFSMSSYHSGYYIDQLYCLPDEQSPLRNPFNYTTTTLFIAFNICWFSLMIFATVAHYILCQKQRKSALERLDAPTWWVFLRSWCLTKNVRNFMTIKRASGAASSTVETDGKDSDKRQRNKVDLAPIEGFKVVCSLLVMTAHGLVIAFGAVYNPNSGHLMISRSWLAMVNVICPAVVDIFFVVTGMIAAKILLNTSRNVLTKAEFWLKFIVYRYARIVPLYFIMHWFLQSMFRFTSNGPLWDYGTSHTGWSKVCQDESLWNIIIPTANFKSPSVHCNGVGWYLANDIYFVFLTPFIMILLVMKPVFAHLAILGSVFAIMANHIRYFYLHDPDTNGLFEWSLMILTRVTDDTSSGYVNPQYRCLSYLIGLSTGHVLDMYERGEIKRWPRAFVVYGRAFVYFIVYLLCFTPYITTFLVGWDESILRVITSLFSGTLHGITSIATAVFLLLLCTGRMSIIARLYSMNFLRPLADISLSTMLVHIPIMYYHTHSMQTLPELNMYNFIRTNVTWWIESFMVSTLVHILYELPLRTFLIKLMIKTFAPSNQAAPKQSQSQGEHGNNDNNTCKEKQN